MRVGFTIYNYSQKTYHEAVRVRTRGSLVKYK